MTIITQANTCLGYIVIHKTETSIGNGQYMTTYAMYVDDIQKHSFLKAEEICMEVLKLFEIRTDKEEGHE